jgi:hypothetical protein
MVETRQHEVWDLTTGLRDSFQEMLAYHFERVLVFDAPAEWRCFCIYGDAL